LEELGWKEGGPLRRGFIAGSGSKIDGRGLGAGAEGEW
jgi:hypothetical protein